MVAKFYVRLSPKTFAICAFAITIILCIYYASYVTEVRQNNANEPSQNNGRKPELVELPPDAQSLKSKYKTNVDTCPAVIGAEADINTVDIFKDFDFQPTWMKTKEYWDKFFEDRFERQKMDSERPPLKVIVIPHSHNDPGWLKTFENYFNSQSKAIMNNMVTKLQEHSNMTFIWSEVAFLNLWWEGAHPSKQKALKSLVKSGRLEITTGGWVMTDEANAHVYAMVDQLIEGHQWLLKNLDTKPQSGWSIDPFGHGNTQPYLLSQSGIKGTVIQRIHYAWKQWFALKQYGDFKWLPNWASNTNILTHNQPFDIYSIKHSCGPHPYICLNFDFRKVVGEYTEYSIKAQPITEKNIKEKSELLLEQYARTGSLFPHNVVLMPLGDDFRYNFNEEWDQQYVNYMKLINYINSHKDLYKTEISFGTPKDYFAEIQKRYNQYPTLKGDFFVYSDIFSEGRPAYWSGYFTTRPFMKLLDRELENNLRAAEIVYSLALNHAKKNNMLPYVKVLERDFEKIIQARRNLGLFQHHDAITGTSKSFVMRDYGLKMFTSLRDTVNVQQNAIQSLMIINTSKTRPDQNIVLSDIERDSYEKMSKKTTIEVEPGHSRQIILYNSLAQPQDHLIQVRVSTIKVKVLDSEGNLVIFQLNPVWNCSETNTKITISKSEYELTFVAKLQALSLATYTIQHHEESSNSLVTIYCSKCYNSGGNEIKFENEHKNTINSIFKIKKIQPGDIQLENNKLKLLFSGSNGFMKAITNKITRKVSQCGIQFAAYKSAQFHSGAYLFMPDPNERDIEKDVLLQYKDQMSVIITSGPVSSELTVFYGPFLVHTVQILHIENSYLSDGIFIENTIDFENPPKNREVELFMRLVTDVQNGEPPEFFTDSSGFQMQKRVKVERIGIEGNYFPITTMTYIQDDVKRVSLITNHAQGAASWQPGFLEVMMERRTLYDDARGMGEGLLDNRKTVNKFWLLLEDIEQITTKKESFKRFENENNSGDDIFEKGDMVRSFNIATEQQGDPKLKADFSRPSLYANQISNALNYPVNVFIVEDEGNEVKVKNSFKFLNTQLPCDLHILTLRTQPDAIYSQFPSKNAFLVLHRQGYDCSVNKNFTCSVSQITENTNFVPVQVNEWQPTTLTGTYKQKGVFSDLANAFIGPMSLQTFNISFS
ncbi:hypothetical protein RN001_007814 [Aquatica leii]|uniref:Alpha-mannosidase n=1 Tax=Aquatica leii TaxID=1421715 RepID=A0AAN7PA06_9COLE|nr:hypothetical protein RN001_007814 [Aquatica leii]